MLTVANIQRRLVKEALTGITQVPVTAVKIPRKGDHAGQLEVTWWAADGEALASTADQVQSALEAARFKLVEPVAQGVRHWLETPEGEAPVLWIAAVVVVGEREFALFC